MGIEIRLTDKHFPVSAILIDFLHRQLIEDTRPNSWHRQLSENLSVESSEILKNAQAKLNTVTRHPQAQQIISRSYDLTMSLMLGATENLAALHDTMKFILVVGCPRSGGSYLTKHLFQALGRRVQDIPSVIGHDGFPDPVPFRLKKMNNAYTTLTRHMAEYMAMAELFFSGDARHDGRLIAPKKATKATYYGAFFNDALGPGTEIVVTARHPVASCISTIEKSGGLPDGHCFAVRSNIESWVRRDIEFLTGTAPDASRNYFDCYLQYWENYHYSLVQSGLLANPNCTVVPFDNQAITSAAEGFYSRFDQQRDVDRFETRKQTPPDPDWKTRGDRAVARVAAVWKRFGHRFPTDEVMQNW